MESMYERWWAAVVEPESFQQDAIENLLHEDSFFVMDYQLESKEEFIEAERETFKKRHPKETNPVCLFENTTSLLIGFGPLKEQVYLEHSFKPNNGTILCAIRGQLIWRILVSSKM